MATHKMRETTISFKIDRTTEGETNVALAKEGAEDRTLLHNFIEKVLKAEIQKHESKAKSSSH